MTNNLKKPKVSRSLTRILSIAFLALSVVVLMVSNGLSLYSNFQNQQAAIYDRQQLIARDASKTVGIFFQEKFGVLETAVDLANPIDMSPQERQITLDSLLGLQPAFRQLALLDINDRLSANTSRLSQVSTEPISNKLADDALTQVHEGNNYISPVYIDDATSEPLVIMAIPVTNIFGEFQGTLAVEVNLKFMWELVNQLEVGETGYAYVVDEDGRLIAYRDTALVLKGENVSYIEAVEEFTESLSRPETIKPDISNRVSFPGETGLSGETMVTTYEPLGTPRWAVIVELPIQEAYQDVATQVGRSVLFILGVAILASLAGIFGARRLAAPLAELTNTANQIAGGELELQATASGSLEVESLATAFNSMTSQLRNLIGDLEQRVSERTTDVELARLVSEKRAKDLQSISEISRTISTEQRLEILLPLVTRLVSEKFDFYHVGIFFVDEARKFAVLQAANSEGGKRMMQRGHRLEAGTGIVGNVVQIGKPRIALDVGTDAVFFNNPDLPETRSEMALPLNVRGQIIGVLDVQSVRPGAFGESDANTLSILADQVAIAIDNARLFGQSQEALNELQRLYRQFQAQEWSIFTKQERKIGYHQSLLGGKPIEVPVKSEEVQEALQKGELVVSDGNNETSLPSIAIPVKLRGQTIGILNVKSPAKNRRWNRDEINLAQAISDRLALALDNARLLQESQRRAAKEQKIGEVTAKIGASINMRSVLQTAVEELGRALPGSEVVIQFKDTDGEKPR